MKTSLFLLATISLFLVSSCIRKGAESKYVKLKSYSLVGDGNDNDSAFFVVNFRNKSPKPLIDPYLRMVIKDTSDKLFKKILFSDSKNFASVGSHEDFSVTFYADNFQYSDEVGKTKFYLEWTNSKGKTSIRRRVEY